MELRKRKNPEGVTGIKERLLWGKRMTRRVWRVGSLFCL